MPDTKPQLAIIPGKPTAEQLEELYKRLTGKEPTDEEREQLRPRLEKQGKK